MATSTLPRVLEPEVMDTAEEASDYDAMDHGVVNAAFADDVVRLLGGRDAEGSVVDIGTGTALIPVAVAGRTTRITLVGVDLAAHMLTVARKNVERSGFADRIRLVHQDGKRTAFADGAFDLVMSNSIVHHIPDPKSALEEMWRLVKAGGRLFVRDLRRPDDEVELARLVTRHAAIPQDLPASERAMHERQRGLFEASLRAALTLEEVRAIATSMGLPPDTVSTTSDRHWTFVATKSP
ncbi:MAG: class I SAM-dependent methyltransferase [Polyangiaceae bacterium]